MVWAAIGLGFKSKLMFINGTLDQTAYQNMLRESGIFDFIRGAGRYFQQDGAPAHRARDTIQFLKEQTNNQLIENWPANSPDLSPIEMLWGIMKRRLNSIPRKEQPATINTLRNCIVQIWENMSQETIDGLIGELV
jgi:hypothetical protein